MREFTARDRLKLMLGGGVLLAGCGGGGGASSGQPPVATTPTPPIVPTTPTTPPIGEGLTPGLLRDFYRNNFKIGTALNDFQVQSGAPAVEIARTQFNSITPEYELKANNLAPTEGVYDFTQADRIVDWAIANGMEVRGHALVWHEATPDYFLQGTRAQIKARLEDYITTVMTHFKGRIKIWDVVNEVVSVDLYNGDQGIGPDRDTPWLQAVGNADYIDWAFNAARAADPDALLFLNDYNTENAQKGAWLIEIVERLIDRGVPFDGVAHQFHIQLNTDVNAALAAVKNIELLYSGLITHITELDVNCYQDPGTCWESETNCDTDIGPSAPASLLANQAQLVKDVFDGLVVSPSVESVTFWGVIDSDSWLNYAPTERYNYPLLFDRDGDPKPMFHALTDPSYEI